MAELPKPAPVPLEFQDACFSFGPEPVVHNITFGVNHGDFMAILGPNGSGKTTLLRMALGLIKPTRGKVLLFGESPDRFKSWSRVGYVPQRVEAVQTRFPATVKEIVSFGLYRGFDVLGAFRRSNRDRVNEALDLAGIGHLANRRVSDLSVGQQQRMLIARALARKPALLLMDEPIAGVDAAGQEQFHRLLRRLNREMGITIVMVSHDIGAVMREATSCACINKEMVFHGPVHRLTSRELSRLYGFPVDILLHDALHEHR
ncbi:MAG: metal ABC transporter ATP-binding protein [Dehalococcoidia bacterium]